MRRARTLSDTAMTALSLNWFAMGFCAALALHFGVAGNWLSFSAMMFFVAMNAICVALLVANRT